MESMWYASHIDSALHPSPTPNASSDVYIADLILNTLKFSVEKNRILLAAFVVMADHWHALFAVDQNQTLPKVMSLINSWIGNKTAEILNTKNTQWQDGYHDCRIRSGKQFRYVRHYIENNPVDKGLVRSINDWP